MKRRAVVASLMAGVVACSLGAVAAPKLAHDGEVGPLRAFVRAQFDRLRSLHSDLNLSQEQRDQIKTVLKSHQTEIASVAKPVVEKRRALRDAVMAKTPSDEAIRSAANDLGKAIGDAAVLASKVKPEVGKVLTTEQKEKVEVFRQQTDKAVDDFIEQIASPVAGTHS